MNVSVFGLGYVGTVSAGCLAADGHSVIGVDPVRTKVDLINAGQSPIIEADIGDLIDTSVRAGRLRGTDDVLLAVRETDLSFVCVGTPSQANGNLDLTYVSRVCEQIGRALQHTARRHTVVIRSTILPGTMHSLVIPVLERASGKSAGIDLGSVITRSFCARDRLSRTSTSLRRPSLVRSIGRAATSWSSSIATWTLRSFAPTCEQPRWSSMSTTAGMR